MIAHDIARMSFTHLHLHPQPKPNIIFCNFKIFLFALLSHCLSTTQASSLWRKCTIKHSVSTPYTGSWPRLIGNFHMVVKRQHHQEQKHCIKVNYMANCFRLVRKSGKIQEFKFDNSALCTFSHSSLYLPWWEGLWHTFSVIKL